MANPNPSPETRFQPGNPGGGKTSEQKRLEYEAAEMAAKARHKLLFVITEKLAALPGGVSLAGVDLKDLLNSDTLRLFKDSEDRAHGTPKQSVQHGNDPDNPLGPTVIRIEAASVNSDDPTTP
jgi:hypothetical protein